MMVYCQYTIIGLNGDSFINPLHSSATSLISFATHAALIRQLSGGGRGPGQSPDHSGCHYVPLFRCRIAKAITGRWVDSAFQLPVIGGADRHRKTSLSSERGIMGQGPRYAAKVT